MWRFPEEKSILAMLHVLDQAYILSEFFLSTLILDKGLAFGESLSLSFAIVASMSPGSSRDVEHDTYMLASRLHF